MSTIRTTEEYVDANFEWTFVDLSDRIKQFIAEDARLLQVKPNLKNHVNFHRMADLGSPKTIRISDESDRDRQSQSQMDYGVSVNAEIGVQDFMESVDKWTFDIFTLSHFTKGHAMQAIAHEIFTRHNLLDKFGLTENQFMRFVIQVERHYKRNPYHNACHAADVLQSVNCIISRTGFINVMNHLEMFSMFLTAILHDIEHTGTNNNFHKNSNSELAKLYVVSVLENHHMRVGLRMLKEYEILRTLSREAHDDFIFMMSTMILSTDMTNHFLLITNMKLLALTGPCSHSRIRVKRIMMLILHCADISNPAKPWDIHKVWVSLLCEEFFAQGDKERELKLPVSPYCDRYTANIATSQIGFMQTFTKETFEVMDDLMEKELVQSGKTYQQYTPWNDCMLENSAKWNGKWKFLKYNQFNDLLSETINSRMSVTPRNIVRGRPGKLSICQSMCYAVCPCSRCRKTVRKGEDSTGFDEPSH